MLKLDYVREEAMYSGTKDGKTYGFYLEPAGLKNAVKLTDAEHMALIDGQAAGKVITWDAPDYKPKLPKRRSRQRRS